MSMRSKEELDAMESPAFAKWAYEHLAIEKPDFRPVRFGHPTNVVDDLPVGIAKMLERLETTQGGLVHMVKTGAACPAAPAGRRWRRVDALGVDGGVADARASIRSASMTDEKPKAAVPAVAAEEDGKWPTASSEDCEPLGGLGK